MYVHWWYTYQSATIIVVAIIYSSTCLSSQLIIRSFLIDCIYTTSIWIIILDCGGNTNLLVYIIFLVSDDGWYTSGSMECREKKDCLPIAEGIKYATNWLCCRNDHSNWSKFLDSSTREVGNPLRLERIVPTAKIECCSRFWKRGIEE